MTTGDNGLHFNPILSFVSELSVYLVIQSAKPVARIYMVLIFTKWRHGIMWFPSSTSIKVQSANSFVCLYFLQSLSLLKKERKKKLYKDADMMYMYLFDEC